MEDNRADIDGSAEYGCVHQMTAVSTYHLAQVENLRYQESEREVPQEIPGMKNKNELNELESEWEGIVKTVMADTALITLS